MLKTENKYFILDNPRKKGIRTFIKQNLLETKSFIYKRLLDISHPKITEKKYKTNIVISKKLENSESWIIATNNTPTMLTYGQFSKMKLRI